MGLHFFKQKNWGKSLLHFKWEKPDFTALVTHLTQILLYIIKLSQMNLNASKEYVL